MRIRRRRQLLLRQFRITVIPTHTAPTTILMGITDTIRPLDLVGDMDTDGARDTTGGLAGDSGRPLFSILYFAK